MTQPLTHLKPVKERKEFDFYLPVYEEALDDFLARINELKTDLLEYKEDGWEGIEQDYDYTLRLKLYLYKYNMVEDEEYDRRITLALKNKPSWEDAPKEAESLGIVLWECDYQYEWTWFYHREPGNSDNVGFVEFRPIPLAN